MENTSSIILLGDFNHGPATPGITWRSPINFGLMTARGLFSANALWCGQCTYCTDNILTGGGFPNYLIDHIYLPTSRASDVIRVEVSCMITVKVDVVSSTSENLYTSFCCRVFLVVTSALILVYPCLTTMVLWL